MLTRTPLLQQSDEEILTIARQLQVAYRLKRTLRYNTERDFSVHSESVAEHIFALLFLKEYFLPLEDPEGTLDSAKISRILIFHDFGEIGPQGDIPYHLKTAADEQLEREAAVAVFASLPPSIRDLAQTSWFEYGERQSPESRFAYALDKLEPSFELLDPVNERSLKRTKHTYRHHIEKKLRATEHFPVMRRFVVAISNDMLKRDVFWVAEPSAAK